MLDIIVEKYHISEDIGALFGKTEITPDLEKRFNRIGETYRRDEDLFHFLKEKYGGVTTVGTACYQLLENAAGGELPPISEEVRENLYKEYNYLRSEDPKRFEEKIDSELARIREENPIYFFAATNIPRFADTNEIEKQGFEEIVLFYNLVERELKEKKWPKVFINN